MADTLSQVGELLFPRDGRLNRRLHQLARLTGASERARAYHEARLPKRSGGERVLQVPSPFLKKVQRALLPLLSEAPLPPCATAYRPGKSLLENAGPHAGNPVLVKLDLRDYFGSVRFPQVFRAIDGALRHSALVGPQEDQPPGIRERGWYNPSLSHQLALLCTLNGALPQGAPTSPLLSNLVFAPIDRLILEYCARRGITYTRYCDDLTFSGRFAVAGLAGFVRALLAQNGFTLNEGKSRVLRGGKRHLVTGVVVNERPQAGKAVRRRLRQEVYYLRRFGAEEHLRRLGDTRFCVGGECRVEAYLLHLLGRIGFVLQIDPRNAAFERMRGDVRASLDTWRMLKRLRERAAVKWNDEAENTVAPY